VSPRSSGRVQSCDQTQAQVRLDQARAFLDAAELIGTVDDDLASPGVAAALAVLAGIAASDTACCVALGQRSRGQDHHQATDLLRQVDPEGRTLARDLARLLDIKDGAHYGMVYVSGQKASAAIKQARRLVDAARALIR
jgi:hypothetical protein